MTDNKKLKSRPAGKNDKINITYTEFAANQEKTEMITGEGKEFDNDALLELLGFEKNANGELSLKAVDHQVDRDSKGKIIRIPVVRRKEKAQEEEKGA